MLEFVGLDHFTSYSNLSQKGKGRESNFARPTNSSNEKNVNPGNPPNPKKTYKSAPSLEEVASRPATTAERASARNLKKASLAVPGRALAPILSDPELEDLSDGLSSSLIARNLLRDISPPTDDERFFEFPFSDTTIPLDPEPSQNQTAIMSTPRTKTMPNRGERGAPNFDCDRPEELIRFLEIAKKLFKDCSIEDDQEKKDYLRHYADGNSYREWKLFDSYVKEKTFADFERELINNYPAASSELNGSLKSLDKVIKKYRGIQVDELNELLSFIRAYKVETASLTKAPALLTNLQLVEKFVSALTVQFGQMIYDRLTRSALSKPAVAAADGVAARRYEDQFDLSDVMDAAIELSRSYTASGFHQSAGGGAGAGVAAANVDKIKSEVDSSIASLADRLTMSEQKADANHQAILAALTQKQANAQTYSQHQNQTAPNNSSQNSNGQRQNNFRAQGQDEGCFYCTDPDHIIANCPAKDEDLLNGKIMFKPEHGRKIFLGDGTDLKTVPGKCTRDKVIYHYKQKTKQMYLGTDSADDNQIASTNGTDMARMLALLHEYGVTRDQHKQQVSGGPSRGHQFQNNSPGYPPAQISQYQQQDLRLDDLYSEFQSYQEFTKMKQDATQLYGNQTRDSPAQSKDGQGGSGFQPVR